MKSLLTLLLQTTFNNPKGRHEVQRQLTPNILKKRLYDDTCTDKEKELIRERLTQTRNL